jgi:hypothetical protein
MEAERARRRVQINRARSVWIAAAIISIGPALVFNLMPQLLAALARAQVRGRRAAGWDKIFQITSDPSLVVLLASR